MYSISYEETMLIFSHLLYVRFLIFCSFFCSTYVAIDLLMYLFIQPDVKGPGPRWFPISHGAPKIVLLKESQFLPSLKLTYPLKIAPGKGDTYWKLSFLGAMLVLGSVLHINFPNICLRWFFTIGFITHFSITVCRFFMVLFFQPPFPSKSKNIDCLHFYKGIPDPTWWHNVNNLRKRHTCIVIIIII